MDAASWIDLVQIIPQDLHDGLCVVMQSGLELNLQSILRLEERFMVCKGRMTGSTEGGITFFLPYDQITCLAYPKPLKEDVLHSWFGEAPAAVEMPSEALAEPAVEEKAPSPPAPVAKPAPLPARPAPAKPAPAPAVASSAVLTSNILPAKAAMIERLRKRAQGAGGSPSAQGTTPKPPPESK